MSKGTKFSCLNRCSRVLLANIPDPLPVQQMPPSSNAQNDNNDTQKDPQKATKVSEATWPVTCTNPTK